MQEKYILYINKVTQIAIVVNNKNNFSLRTLKYIIDDDTTKYKPVTKEHRYTLYCQFIKDKGFNMDKDCSIYKRLYDLSSEIDPIIYQSVLSLKMGTKC